MDTSKKVLCATILGAMVTCAFTTNRAVAQTSSPPADNATPSEFVRDVHVAMGDVDGDGLFDVVVGFRTRDVVELWKAVDDNNFVLAGSWDVPEAAGVVLADFDGDEVVDMAFGSDADDTVTLAYGVGDFTFNFDEPFEVDVSPGILVAIDRCEDFLPELIVSNDAQTTMVFVESPIWEPEVLPVTPDFDLPDCPESSSGPCNDYTEPDCDPDPQFSGIQECMRAAKCRQKKCHWAACIHYHMGGFWTTWFAQNTTCGLVADLELAGCISAVIPGVK
jgi:hypothetical protein